MNIRPVNSKDQEQITVALTRAVNKASRKRWIATVDLPTAIEHIMSGNVQAYILEDTYLIVADIVTPWYSAPGTKVLAELLVLRVYQGPGKFSDIPRALTAIAAVEGAGSIVVGTALTVGNRGLQRMYAREGFKVEAVELFKSMRE